MAKYFSSYTYIAVLIIIVFFVLFAVALSSRSPSTISAETYFVAGAGSDNNPGTESSQFRTIQRAVDISKPGDTILIRSGTYPSVLMRGKQATANAPIIIKAYPDEAPVIDQSLGGGDGLHGFAIIDSSYIVVDGLEITDSQTMQLDLLSKNACDTGDLEIIKTNKSRGIKVDKTSRGTQHDVILRNLHVHHVSRTGIGGYGGGSNNHFINNHVHDIGGYGGDVHGDALRFEGNDTHDTNAYGMHLWPGLTSSLLDRNSVRLSGKAPCYYHEASDSVKTNFKDGIIIAGSDTVIQNTIISENEGAGIRLVDTRDVSIFHATIFRNGGGGIVEGAGTSHATVKNSIIFENAGAGDLALSAEAAQSSNVSFDPRFVDAASGNLRLRVDSLAIDAGLSLGISHDFDRAPRPKGMAPDIGAYEY